MSRLDRFLAGAVVAVALAFGWSGLTAGYEGPYDEGNTLSAAWRVALGDVQYRDFWSLHPPGTTWLLAGAFRVFGATLGVERAVKLGVVAFAAALVFLLARLAARAGWAAAAALVFVVLPTQTLSLRSRDTGLVLVLATLFAACRPTTSPRRRAFVAGLLAGATIFFKQDFVLAAAVSGAVALGGPALLRAPIGRRGRTLAEALLPFAVGLFAGVASLAVTLAALGAFREFFEQAIVFPATSFERFRSLPLSLRFEQLAGAVKRGIFSNGFFDEAVVPLLFGVAFAAAVVGLVRGTTALGRREGNAAAPLAPVLRASSLACLFLLAGPFQRADLEHLNPALALALVALAALAGPLGGPAMPRVRLAGIAALAALALVSFAAGPGARGAAFPPDLVATARFVAARTAPGERIFVGNTRHDLLVFNAPLIYFLAARPNATRYDNLHPGVVTTRPVQEEIVRSIESAGTRWIVLWESPPPNEPNASSVSSGVLILDEWIARHAREEARFGSYRVLRVEERAALPAPAR
jgi:hypothetical protein